MNSSYKKVNNLTGWAVFLIAAITYLLTIEPNFSFWDCGEYISSAVKLEVTHSPGAVFFQILGAVWAMLAFGDGTKYSVVINAMSAIMSAFAILFLFWTITHIARKVLFVDTEPENFTRFQKIMLMLSGAVGALTFTFTDTFWFSAVEGEVYAAASCFTALLLWLMCKWENDFYSPRADRWLILISLLIGLSVGVHLMVILVVPTLGYIYYVKKYKFTWKSFIIANIVVGFVFLLVFKIIFPLTMAFFGKSEIFFVNNLQMPFNTGSVFAFLVILLVFYFSLKYTVKKQYVTANTIILSIWFMLIGFSSWIVLPIRANANPPINLNDPDNAIGMLDYYNRAQYGDWPVFYGANYTAYLDPEGITGVEDNGPVYEKDEKTGRYLETSRRWSYKFNPEHVSILPRMYNPDSGVMENYGLMEGYPDFTANPDYVKSTTESYIEDYIQSNNLSNLPQEQMQGLYDQLYNQIQPKVAAEQQKVVDSLKYLKSHDQIDIAAYNKFSSLIKVKKPQVSQNLDFMMTYQMGYMFIRYFLWNFAGRQNDYQGYYENTKGNWITGISFFDNWHLGDQSKLPAIYKNKATNTYFFLPLILGLIGFFFQLNRDPGRNFALVALFLLSSAGIILYTSIKAFEPRERDYALVTSFYTFAIWIGLGVTAIMYGLSLLKKEKVALTLGFITLGVPVLVGFQNWDDHDRSKRYTAYDFSKSYLQGLDKNNPILFVYGDNDTYPLWALQETEEFRSDAKVVNYTLLGTAWYIDQVLRKTYEAPALPSSMSHEEYRDGVNDQVILLSHNTWKQLFASFPNDSIPAEFAPFKKYAVQDSMSAKDAIAFLKDKKIQKAVKSLYAKDFGGRDYGFLPLNKIYIPVNKANALKYGIVKPEDKNLMVDNVVLTLNKSRINKDALAVLNLFANYNWDRSIYFSSGGTYSQSNIMYSQNYLEYQGLVSKLVPIYTKDDGVTQGRINPNTLYHLVMNYKFGNLKDPKAYFDETCRSNILNYRMSCGAAAIALAKAGDKKRANDVLELINTEIPLDLYPASPSFNSIISAYFYIGKEKEGLALADKYKKQVLEELNYYLALPLKSQTFVTDDMYKLSSYYRLIVSNMVETYIDLGEKEKAVNYIAESFKPLDERLKKFEMLGKTNAKNDYVSLQNLDYTYKMIFQVLYPIDSVYVQEKAEEISNIFMKLE
ncbi:DUF2723 domain-containing protein [Apibacter raozihei]|uniref:glycosyltransferase family 117 protein n=1 Tax=Apibacter raozihei TaxID=2500547 RepID=UPI000FE393F4|nr:DUF2723 domain-containing protein [Apibacter raozihei]